MFPHLSDLLNYLFGTHIVLPVQSYGFMLATAFVAAALLLHQELKRLEKGNRIPALEKKSLTGTPAGFSELLLSGVSAAVIGWKLAGLLMDYAAFRSDPQDYILSGKGSITGAILLGGVSVFLTWYQKKKKQLKVPVVETTIVHPSQLTINFTIIAAVFGIAGSKLFDMAEHINDLVRDPFGTIFSFSGLSFYGGLICAGFAVVWYARRNKIRFPFIMDATAPGLILAYAVGRIGCQLSGDGCWGIVNNQPKPSWLGFLPDWMWSFSFPHNVINEGILIPGCTTDHCFILQYPVFPTSFYETVLGVVIFIILWSVRKKLTTPGYLFSLYLILNGTERYFIEKIRVNRMYAVMGMQMTQAEIIALVLVILGSAGFWFFKRMEKQLRDKQIHSARTG
jgi:phosphatidylglycerol---prolipoprotein diacylglyceryl transferase